MAGESQSSSNTRPRVLFSFFTCINYAVSVYLLWICVRKAVFFSLLAVTLEERGDLTKQILQSILYCFFGIILCAWIGFQAKRGKRIVPAILIPASLIVSVLITGLVPYLGALAGSRNVYRNLGGGIYSYSPNYVITENRFNAVSRMGADGYRTCPYSVPNSGVSIALVGDSFTFGLHLNEKDTLCAALGDALKKKDFGPFNIHNIGFPGANFASYLRTAARYVNSTRTDLLFIEYLPGNDLLPFDSIQEIRLLQDSLFYKFLSILFGTDTTARMYRVCIRFAEKNESGSVNAGEYAEEIRALKALNEKGRVVIFCYYGKDAFIDLLQKNIPGLNVLILKLPEDAFRQGNPEYIFPNDGHPTGKANLLFAEQLAGYIAARRNAITPKTGAMPAN